VSSLLILPSQWISKLSLNEKISTEFARVYVEIIKLDRESDLLTGYVTRNTYKSTNLVESLLI